MQGVEKHARIFFVVFLLILKVIFRLWVSIDHGFVDSHEPSLRVLPMFVISAHILILKILFIDFFLPFIFF